MAGLTTFAEATAVKKPCATLSVLPVRAPARTLPVSALPPAPAPVFR
jgi:hypothetical protein